MHKANHESPRTIILIGAVASVAQTRHHMSNEKGGSVVPPLDRSFFIRALEEDWRDTEITANIHRLRELVENEDKYADPY